jgi:hypothetical protein
MDDFTGYVAWAMRSARAADVRSPGTFTHLSLLLRVRDFVRRNADLLGLSADDLASLTWEIGGDGQGKGTLLGWGGAAAPSVPLKEALPGRSRSVSLDYDFLRDGELNSIRVRISPAAAICTAPALTAEAARKVPGIVGTKLGATDFTGSPFSAGKVRPEDIGKAELTIDAQRTEQALEYRLVYRVTVHRGLPWAFVIDAMSGKVMRVDQLFET